MSLPSRDTPSESTLPDFERLHERDDPFGYHTRWYEARKRALVLASLCRPRYASGWELGCSNGVLTAALATRCDHLLATDMSASAIAQAQRALADQRHVTVRQARHPGDWPTQTFDLVVCSEMGYYLRPEELPPLRAGLHAALADDGLLIACHWQVPFEQAASTAAQVHDRVGEGLVQVFAWRDADFLLQGWMRGQYSVAAQEGLR